jgi:hypothetical protein
MQDARKYISEHAAWGIRGYLFNELKENGSAIWFTKTDIESEYKYPDRALCND